MYMVDRLGNILKGVASYLFAPFTVSEKGGETMGGGSRQHKEQSLIETCLVIGGDQSGLHVRGLTDGY